MQTGAPEKKRRKTTKDKVESLRSRLNQYHARLPGHLFTGEWREIIGPAYPLVGVLIVTCDWNSGRWHGGIPELAIAIGVTEKTIGNWLRQLKKINGFEIDRHPYSITIYLPEPMRPKSDRKNQGTRKEKPLIQKRNDVRETRNKGEFQDFAQKRNSFSKGLSMRF